MLIKIDPLKYFQKIAVDDMTYEQVPTHHTMIWYVFATENHNQTSSYFESTHYIRMYI